MLLDTMRALAHIGATSSFYTSRIRPIKFLVSLSGKSFSVDIDKSAIRYYSGIFLFFYLFFKFFILLIQVLVIWSLRFVCDCS